MPATDASLRSAVLTRQALHEFVRDPGRSAFVTVTTGSQRFAAGVGEHVPRPAASLLKLPLALATEQAFARSSLPPERRVRVADLQRSAPPAMMNVMSPAAELTAADVLGLAVAASDNDCAAWLFRAVGIAAVREAITAMGCRATDVTPAGRPGIGPLSGTTTAADAVRMLAAATDRERFPRSSRALANSVHASRIPLGAERSDLAIAHKTGSLPGVGHDVAVLSCDRATVFLAFLCEEQHDTVVTGYEMGLCTRTILQAWGLGAHGSAGVA